MSSGEYIGPGWELRNAATPIYDIIEFPSQKHYASHFRGVSHIFPNHGAPFCQVRASCHQQPNPYGLRHCVSGRRSWIPEGNAYHPRGIIQIYHLCRKNPVSCCKEAAGLGRAPIASCCRWCVSGRGAGRRRLPANLPTDGKRVFHLWRIPRGQGRVTDLPSPLRKKKNTTPPGWGFSLTLSPSSRTFLEKPQKFAWREESNTRVRAWTWHGWDRSPLAPLFKTSPMPGSVETVCF